MNELQSYIQTYFGINGKSLAPVGNLFKESHLSKHSFLLKKDQYAKQLHFVKSGFLRVFSNNASGEKEITQWISTEASFLTDLSSFMFGTPSRWNIQALTDCELYSISKTDYQNISAFVSNWDSLEKLFLAKCFVTLENRVFAQLSMSAEEKVLDLMQMSPAIFNQVPLQYIASMLGITPETLSRVRRSLNS